MWSPYLKATGLTPRLRNASQPGDQVFGYEQGKRTRREDHAPSYRPQMSSGRLFLERVARQHCPSPLHRHEQISMSSSRTRANGDISTSPAWGHFYFALTIWMYELDVRA